VLAQKTLVGLWAGSDDLLGWQLGVENPTVPNIPAFSLTAADGRVWPIAVQDTRANAIRLFVDGELVLVSLHASGHGKTRVEMDSEIFQVDFSIADRLVLLQGPFGPVALTVVPFLSLDAAAGARSGLLRAPMMGSVVRVNVKAGDTVNAGDVLVVEESMKMELLIESPGPGTVRAVNCAVGDMVARQQILVELDPLPGT
jgi:acetyl/propionyl-CoA carboxylase alpha subunit